MVTKLSYPSQSRDRYGTSCDHYIVIYQEQLNSSQLYFLFFLRAAFLYKRLRIPRSKIEDPPIRGQFLFLFLFVCLFFIYMRIMQPVCHTVSYNHIFISIQHIFILNLNACSIYNRPLIGKLSYHCLDKQRQVDRISNTCRRGSRIHFSGEEESENSVTRKNQKKPDY